VENCCEDLGFDLHQLDAVIVTHAHSDHCKGVVDLALKYEVSVFAHEETLKVLAHKKSLKWFKLPANLIEPITQARFPMGEIIVNCFRLPHAGWVPGNLDNPGVQLGFVFEYDGKRLAYATDLGMLPENLHADFSGCDAYFLEANHDPAMQLSSRRDKRLIDRNLSDYGHLSNRQTAEILKRCILPKTTVTVMLAHLSEECNHPDLAVGTLKQTLTPEQVEYVKIEIAPQKKISSVLDI
jgi:phosphoribosyl 1,2-cyclic phosphodiesterase